MKWEEYKKVTSSLTPEEKQQIEIEAFKIYMKKLEEDKESISNSQNQKAEVN